MIHTYSTGQNERDTLNVFSLENGGVSGWKTVWVGRIGVGRVKEVGWGRMGLRLERVGARGVWVGRVVVWGVGDGEGWHLKVGAGGVRLRELGSGIGGS